MEELPPVFSLALYNGDRRWVVPLALHELIGLPEDTPVGGGSWTCAII